MKNFRLHLLLALLTLVSASAAAQIVSADKTDGTTVTLRYADGQTRVLDFYGPDIVRIFHDPAGGTLRDPDCDPEAHILVSNPREAMRTAWGVETDEGHVHITTMAMTIDVDRATGCMTIRQGGRTVLQEATAVQMEDNRTAVTLTLRDGEQFYGGGMQNGRYSHRGHIIQILNTNNWVDGGVSSPAPFCWSSEGYGLLFHTFRPGRYDLGATDGNQAVFAHDTDYLDLFVMVADGPTALLSRYYQLTGYPVLLPKFGFYEGHLNAYNRDYWTPVPDDEQGGILFEDGHRYRESQKANGGIRETLNDELTDSLGRDSYLFSARAVIDRYAAHDMPFGWILPNDGYATGYGQTGSLEGNIYNLRAFSDYAHEQGVQVGLWTQSDLYPKEGVEPLLQRDIVREVRDGSVRVLKTDVAWVGAGYSFGLNGVADVANVMREQGGNARPFIISVDGWAGTQRYAGIWSGDQTGGNWDYIRYHIPSYIGSGLSGQPNVGSDVDGIFGGKNLPVNVREFQWKTFTPLELNMDGWGANQKYPHALGDRAEDINRRWLKCKAALMPYTYSLAHEAAIGGWPMVRPMASVEKPADSKVISYNDLTKYQFMYGPSLLVAPIYQDTAADPDGNDVRHGIVLPSGRWLDPYEGVFLDGGCIYNSYPAPLERLPLFVREGAIIPLTAPHNQPRDIDGTRRAYLMVPADGTVTFRDYDDDGITEAWRDGACVEAQLSMEKDGDKVIVTLPAYRGSFDGFRPQKSTRLLVAGTFRKAVVKADGRRVKGVEVTNWQQRDGIPSATLMAAGISVVDLPDGLLERGISVISIPAVNTAATTLAITLKGFQEVPTLSLPKGGEEQASPKSSSQGRTLDSESGAGSSVTATTVTLSWADTSSTESPSLGEGSRMGTYSEIEFDGHRYTHIVGCSYTFAGLQPETEYTFRLRNVGADGASPWQTFTATTAADPLQYAIHGIRGRCSAPDQGGQHVDKLFDFDEGTVWHTQWGQSATPFTLDIDLGCTILFDRLDYLPREDAGNGTLLSGTFSYSLDGIDWSDPQPFRWNADGTTKTLRIANPNPRSAPNAKRTLQPSVRYLRLNIEEGRGNFGSGRELYVFRVPGSEVLLPGDINRDGRVDMDDFTSYTNYMGLRTGDPEFDGYVSAGDVDHNGRIDAYDVSVVATQLRGGIEHRHHRPLQGTLTLSVPAAAKAKAGDEVTVTIDGHGLAGVNAFSCALPYDAADWEFVSLEAVGTKEMENLTNDRLHAAGDKVLYPTFVNTGDRETLDGDGPLCRITFRARRAARATFTLTNTMLVDKMNHKKTE